MSRINQIQIRYTPVEDRILLRLNTEDASEFRFWITRRFAKMLSASLMNLLSSSADIQAYDEQEVRQAVMSFKHEEAVAQADFAKTFHSQPQHLPLGDAPVLLSNLTVSRNDEGNPLLCMYPEEGKGIDLALQQQLLHSISKLFSDALQEADWGIDFSLGGNAAEHSEDERPELLN